MKEKKVSVIVPVYNVEKYIERCILSIIEQTYMELDIILVVDGAMDNSGEICNQYEKKDTRIRVVHQVNSGVSVARNKGIEIARGQYIMFVDADDSLEHDAIKKAVLALEQNKTDMVLLGHTVVRYGKDDIIDKVETHKGFDSGKYKIKDYCRRIRFSEYGVITGWEYAVTKLYCKDVIDKKKVRFTPGLCHGEDTEFVLQYLRHIDSVFVVEDCLYNYYIKNFDSGIVSSATIFRNNMYELTRDTFLKLKRFLIELGVFDKEVAAGFYHAYINEVVKLIYRFYRSDCPMTEEQKKDKLRLILQESMLREGIDEYLVRNSSEDMKMPKLLKEMNYDKISEYAFIKAKQIYECTSKGTK